MLRFDAPIDKFYRNRWYRFSMAALEWTYRGDLKVGGTLKVKLQKTPRGWSYHIHRSSGGLNYVVAIGQSVPNVSHGLLSGMLWAERQFAASNGPTVAHGGASVVCLADYRTRVTEQHSTKAARDVVPA